MKLLFIVFSLITLVPVNFVLGQNNTPYAHGLPDGNYWTDLDESSKEHMIFALLMGYEWGFSDGFVSGSSNTPAARSAPTMPMFFNRPGYYVDQVDAFYKTFPLCKKIDLLSVFGNLLSLWHKDTLKSAGNRNMRDISYEQIGQMCVRKSKQ